MRPNKTLNIIGIILLIITSLNALAAGYSMIVEPTGKDLGMSVETVLQYSPFTSFLIPGITLFLTIGLLSIVTIFFVFRRWKNHDLMIIAQGFIISGWIFFQVIFLKEFNWLHAVVGSIGIYTIAWGFITYRNNRTISHSA
ncbi:MAG: hypothetical protein ACM3ME_01615 [Chloroflexota bacterium]|nr:hypothetical protein [Lentimicrobium sp.]